MNPKMFQKISVIALVTCLTSVSAYAMMDDEQQGGGKKAASASHPAAKPASAPIEASPTSTATPAQPQSRSASATPLSSTPAAAARRTLETTAPNASKVVPALAPVPTATGKPTAGGPGMTLAPSSAAAAAAAKSSSSSSSLVSPSKPTPHHDEPHVGGASLLSSPSTTSTPTGRPADDDDDALNTPVRRETTASFISASSAPSLLQGKPTAGGAEQQQQLRAHFAQLQKQRKQLASAAQSQEPVQLMQSHVQQHEDDEDTHSNNSDNSSAVSSSAHSSPVPTGQHHRLRTAHTRTTSEGSTGSSVSSRSQSTPASDVEQAVHTLTTATAAAQAAKFSSDQLPYSAFTSESRSRQDHSTAPAPMAASDEESARERAHPISELETLHAHFTRVEREADLELRRLQEALEDVRVRLREEQQAIEDLSWRQEGEEESLQRIAQSRAAALAALEEFRTQKKQLEAQDLPALQKEMDAVRQQVALLSEQKQRFIRDVQTKTADLIAAIATEADKFPDDRAVQVLHERAQDLARAVTETMALGQKVETLDRQKAWFLDAFATLQSRLPAGRTVTAKIGKLHAALADPALAVARERIFIRHNQVEEAMSQLDGRNRSIQMQNAHLKEYIDEKQERVESLDDSSRVSSDALKMLQSEIAEQRSLVEQHESLLLEIESQERAARKKHADVLAELERVVGHISRLQTSR